MHDSTVHPTCDEIHAVRTLIAKLEGALSEPIRQAT